MCANISFGEDGWAQSAPAADHSARDADDFADGAPQGCRSREIEVACRLAREREETLGKFGREASRTYSIRGASGMRLDLPIHRSFAAMGGGRSFPSLRNSRFCTISRQTRATLQEI